MELPLRGVPATAPTLVFSARVELGTAFVVLPSSFSWDLSLPPSAAVFLGGGWGVLPVVALGRGLAVASAGLGLAMADGAE